MSAKILGIVMAGGEGTRLQPLTRDRAKPAVPFGGKYRIIDFVLSNFINSEIYAIHVLVQFKSQSLTGLLQGGVLFALPLGDKFFYLAGAAKNANRKPWLSAQPRRFIKTLSSHQNLKPEFGGGVGENHFLPKETPQGGRFPPNQ